MHKARDDTFTNTPAPRAYINNGTGRQNVHISKFASENNPSSRFNNKETNRNIYFFGKKM